MRTSNWLIVFLIEQWYLLFPFFLVFPVGLWAILVPPRRRAVGIVYGLCAAYILLGTVVSAILPAS